ncbi:MAG: branched-chain amino acid ABC transporter permease [Desulfobacterales bacterium]|nr:MAG: branched-chain amino acid ABC transporter permease [Desulfobacterales bacterium]
MANVQKIDNFNGFQKTLDAVCLTPLGFFGLALLAVLPFIPPFNQEYLIRWMVVGLFMAAQAVAFDFTGGYINIVNFGFAAFVGLGAYTSGILAARLGLSPWFGMFVGVLPAALVGFLTGVLTLRLRGIFAAVMAWFISLAFWGLATKLVFLTEGPLGLNCPTLLQTSSNLPYFYIIFAMFMVTYIVLRRIVRSHMGLAFKAIGQNMEAARTSGINPTRYRIINFTLSCAFAGWLGGFYAHYYGILMPDVMHTAKTIEVLVVVYIGGRASLWGGAFAAIPFVFAMEMVRSVFSQYPGLNLIFYGLFLILIMIYYPGGAAQLYQSLIERLKNPFFLRLVNGVISAPAQKKIQASGLS